MWKSLQKLAEKREARCREKYLFKLLKKRLHRDCISSYVTILPMKEENKGWNLLCLVTISQLDFLLASSLSQVRKKTLSKIFNKIYNAIKILNMKDSSCASLNWQLWMNIPWDQNCKLFFVEYSCWVIKHLSSKKIAFFPRFL